MRLPQPRSPAGAKSCTPGTWGYRAATTAAWASSTVLRWGNTRPYTPVSSACLITHWLRSRAFGGIRTIGTTSGCRLPFSAILLRFSSTLGDGTEADEDPAPDGEDQCERDPRRAMLLDRLLYSGVLPRYAFPTDVATFHVFDRSRSSGFRPIFSFAPSQGLPIALSQYAPGKQVWISGKCYTSGAIYSPSKDDRRDAWKSKRLYC